MIFKGNFLYTPALGELTVREGEYLVVEGEKCAGFYRAKGHRSFYMGVLRFNLLFKFQMLCGFASIGIRNSFHPQLFPGGQTLFSLCKFFLDPLGFSPCMGQFFIRCLRRELVSGKLQLGSLFRILR